MYRFLLAIIVVLAMGCSSGSGPEKPDQSPKLMLGKTWVLQAVNGQDVQPGPNGRKASLILERQSDRVIGFSGCSQYFGTYSLTEGVLSIEVKGMTKFACPEGVDDSGYLQALRSAKSFKVEDATLRLLGKDGAELAKLHMAGE